MLTVYISMVNSSNKYDNLDFCLNTLYDYAYNRNNTKICYELKNIALSEIDVDDIKKDVSYDKTQVFSKQLEYKSKFDKLYVLFTSKDLSATIRVGVYNKDIHNFNDKTYGPTVDMMISYMFSETALQDNYPFILLPVVNFDVDYKELVKLNKKVADTVKTHFDVTDQSKCYVQLYEQYNNTVSLREYLDKNIDSMDVNAWRTLFFYVLYTVAKLNSRFTGFRHNQLDLDSVFICTDNSKNNNKSVKLSVANTKFSVPSTLGKFNVKITNFYKSIIGDKVLNRDVDLDMTKANPYYDVHYFFQSLLNYIKSNSKKLPIEVTDFIDKILPKKFRSSTNSIGLDEHAYFQNVVEILTPILILSKNNFFVQFIIEDNMNSESNNISPITEDYTDNVEYSVTSSLTADSERQSRFFGVPKKTNKTNKKGGKSVSGYRYLAKGLSNVLSTESNKDKKDKDSEVEVNTESSLYNLSDSEITEIKSKNNKQHKGSASNVENAFMNLFGAKKEVASKVGYGHNLVNNNNSNEASAFNSIPENYEGALPDWAQAKLGPVGMQGMQPGLQQMQGMQDMGGLQQMQPYMQPQIQDQMQPYMQPQIQDQFQDQNMLGIQAAMQQQMQQPIQPIQPMQSMQQEFQASNMFSSADSMPNINNFNNFNSMPDISHLPMTLPNSDNSNSQLPSSHNQTVTAFQNLQAQLGGNGRNGRNAKPFFF